MRAFAGFAALVLLLTGCGTLVNQPTPQTPMKVAYVSAHLDELHGKTVRLRGEMNECRSLTCKICDNIEDDDTCLGLNFYGDSSNAVDLMEELYRFATITIDARIDSSCGSPKGDSRVVVICTDRASAIEDARVVTVESRKPATRGRIDTYVGQTLTRITGTAEQAMLSRLKGPLDYIFDDDDWPQIALFEEPPYRDDDDQEIEDPPSKPSYWLCQCIEEDCAGRWPKRGGEIVRSPANPYACLLAAEINGAWLVWF